MANTLKIRQSAVAAKVPTTAQLQLGELALNTYDGRLFAKKNVSGTESIVEFISNSGTWGINITGSAATLTTARTINGTSFNGSANITTTNWGTARTLTIGNTGKSVDGSAAVSWSLAEMGALPLTGGTLTGDLYASAASKKLGRFTVLQSGYLEGTPLNFRFDQDCLRYANRWGTATITAPAFTAGELDALVSQYIGAVNLESKTPPCSIEITGISIGSSSNGAFFPYVLLHAGNQLGSVKMEVLKAAAPTTWEVAYDGAIPSTGYVVAEYTSGAGNLIGVRWTFYGYAASAHYIRSIGCISRNGVGFAWSLMKGGDTCYGNLTIASGYALTAPRLVATVATGVAPLTVTSTTVVPNLNADMVDGKHVGTSGDTIPLLDAANTWSSVQKVPCLLSDDPVVPRSAVFRDLAQYSSDVSNLTGALVIVLGRGLSAGTFYNARILITGAYQREISVEVGGYFKTDNTWANTQAVTSHATILSAQFSRTPEGWPCVVLANNIDPVASSWINYIRCRIDPLALGWYGAENANNLNPAYYTTTPVTDLTGYTLGTVITPALSALPGGGGTLTGPLILTNSNTSLLAHAGSAPTAMWRHDGNNSYLLLVSAAGATPSSTSNTLRPFTVNLTTGAVTLSEGATINSGLTVGSGGATINGGLSAYSPTNDYTQATVKFGRDGGGHLALHGGGSGNFLTHVVADANPDPFQIDIRTETKFWRYQFAVSDGFLIPGQGIRWGNSVGNAMPTTTTRSAGTRIVVYPALSATAVDFALGYLTNTFWTSISQQSGRCFKQFAGTTPIAALHGDGTPFVYQATPVTQDTAATLTAAQLRNGIVTSTPTAAITLTLPTGANTNDTLWDSDLAIDWSVINLATDGARTITLASGYTHSINGNAVVAANTSARFRTMKTAYVQGDDPIFATYRIS